jgi:hypothetical protein
MEDKFKVYFNDRFGEYAKLLSLEELDNSHLLGPESMCDKAKMRFGDFCAMLYRDYALSYVSDNFDRSKLKVGCHSGSSDDEMQIPVIVLN